MDIDTYTDKQILCYNCNFLTATELCGNSMVCRQCAKQIES